MAGATWRRQVNRAPRPTSATARSRQAASALAGARVVFQPIVSVATGSLVAVEALTRFPHEPGFEPEPVFAGAHEDGYGPELEALCVRNALARREALSPGTLVAVNLSPKGLRAFASAPFWPADLTGVIVELTEQDADDPEGVVAMVAGLRERGAALAVDDVGSGYAGLLRVARLRPDYVKVDKQIVSGPADSDARTAVLDALVTLSHRLGAAVIAEGVEDIAEVALLAEMDVDYAQGYGIGRPSWPPQPVAEHVVTACRAARRRVLDGRATPGLAAARTSDVYAVTAALRGADDHNDLQSVIDAATEELGVDNVGVSIIGADATLREIAASAPVDPTPYRLSDYPATVASFQTGRALEIQLDDPTGDVAEQEVLRSFGHASLLLVPVLLDGEPIGAVEVSNRTPRRWGSGDITYAHGLASHLGPVLTRLGVAPG